MAEKNPLNLPPDVVLDTSFGAAAPACADYTVVRRGAVGLGNFFRQKTKNALPWFWHRWADNEGAHAENKNECVYRILQAVTPTKPPHITFAEHLISETLQFCVREPSAERRVLAEFILKQAFAAVGTQDPGLRADWKSMLAGIGLGGIATYAAMAGKEQK